VVIKLEPTQVHFVHLAPLARRFGYLNAVEAELGLDPVLGTNPVADQLSATPYHLPVKAFLSRWNPNTFQNSLRQ
jgi:hypothetical protein